MKAIKDWLGAVGARLAVAGVIGTYFVLGYRVDQLENAVEKQTSKVEALVERVTILVTREEERRRPPGGPSQEGPPNQKAEPPPLDERIEDLIERLDRIERERREPSEPRPEEPKR